MKFEKKVGNRAEEACYLRRIDTDKYQVWTPETKSDVPRKYDLRKTQSLKNSKAAWLVQMTKRKSI